MLIGAGAAVLLTRECIGTKEELESCQSREIGPRIGGGALILAGGLSWLFAKELTNLRPEPRELEQIGKDAQYRYQAAAPAPAPTLTVTPTVSADAIGLGVVATF